MQEQELEERKDRESVCVRVIKPSSILMEETMAFVTQLTRLLVHQNPTRRSNPNQTNRSPNYSQPAHARDADTARSTDKADPNPARVRGGNVRFARTDIDPLVTWLLSRSRA